MITVAFLDVGQGDSTVVVLPSGDMAYLIDCPNKHAQTVLNYLSEHNVSTLGIVFVTHSDADHLGGVPRIIEDFGSVSSVAWNLDRTNIKSRYKKTLLRSLLTLQKERAIKRFEPRSGTSDSTVFDREAVSVTVLHPSTNFLTETALANDTNNGSVLLKLEYAGKRVLLPGDLMLRGWREIIDEDIDISAHILKYPHHGAWYDASQNYDLAEVYGRVSPNFTVISTGTTNQYGHPSKASIRMLRANKAAFLCTQATKRCRSKLTQSSYPTPCAGTIEVEITEDGKVEIHKEYLPPDDCLRDIEQITG